MELAFVEWLRQQFGKHQEATIRVGIGDDAAVLAVGGDEELVVTTDMLMDGIDFDLREHSAHEVGRKALAANLSDLAAMGARPWAAFVSVALPAQKSAELARQLYEGMAPLAARYHCTIAGGDTNCWNQPLVINVCLLGRCPAGRAWLRRGAAAGDQLVVTNSLGGSILGKHIHFEPRVEEASYIRQHYQVHAACDISDGLALDLWRLCQASGCGAVVRAAAVPISSDAHRLAARTGRQPLDHALGDGEDFELLLAMPPPEAHRLCQDTQLPVPVTIIGECTKDTQLWLEFADASRRPLPRTGFQHGPQQETD